MRIDTLPAPSNDREVIRASTPGQDSFGQTMLTLERGMWPGARAGAAAVEALPQHAVSAAAGGSTPDARAHATPAPLESLGANALADPRRGGIDANPASPWHDAMPAWTALDGSGATQAQAASGNPVPYRENAAMPREPEAIHTGASGPARNSQAAVSTDQLTVLSGPSGDAVIVRFDAPPEQRKALFDALAAELRRRGQSHRPIIINGATYAASTRGKP